VGGNSLSEALESLIFAINMLKPGGDREGAALDAGTIDTKWLSVRWEKKNG
jgi:hypothetical protein